MCSYLTIGLDVRGSAKGPDGWFPIERAVVSFDHPWSTPADHTLNIDLRSPTGDPSARIAIELTAESAQALVESIRTALDSGRAAG